MNKDLEKRTIETCFSPALFPFIQTSENFIVVIVDVLRATTAICTAFENGAIEIVPIAKIKDTLKYKNSGYMIAGERDGIVIEGADFGNSPFNFSKENVKDKKIVITTTNGTQAIEQASISDTVVLGAFANISVLANWLYKQNKNVVIFCSGWKNKFNLEDTIMAGALSELLITKGFSTCFDSTYAAIDLWNIAKPNVLAYIEKASHRHRLKKIGLDDVLEYCFTQNTTNVIPFLRKHTLINILKN
ncbi:MAG: 2-phosphosulfolactate phosphatase [Bacteroidetes bacterium]|nr:2-phosphosulfolactate phosphatase [Bacteroidota bacterium]